VSESDKIRELRSQLSAMSDLLEQEKIKQRLPKNMDFLQVTKSELRNLTDLSKKNQLSFEILMSFAQVMNKQNAIIMSYATMQTIIGKSRVTLSNAVKVLREDKWIQVVKIGTANAYVLNSAVFWTDKGFRKETATFTAQVVTTLDEQDKDLRKNQKIKLKRTPDLQVNEKMVQEPEQQDIETLT
jgi:hypothetical protein